MPADWVSFVSQVSQKLSSNSIKDNQDLAIFLADQYTLAVVGKAQSPFGNIHQTGRAEILVKAFKKSFDLLTENPNPTLEEKEKDPNFSEPDEGFPESQSQDMKQDEEYLKWASENPTLAPNFTFFQFFETGISYPKTAQEAVPYIVERLIFQNDGSKEFKKWISSLSKGYEGKIGQLVEDEYAKQTKGLTDSQFLLKKNQIKLNRKIFQLPYSPETSQIPNYLTRDFIAKFTYLGKSEFTIGAQIVIDLAKFVFDTTKISESLKLKVKLYGNSESGEFKKYSDALQKWGESLSQASAEENIEEPEPEDPYEIMAKGILDYWKSTLQQPLSSLPPVPPCIVTAPGLGVYNPISYGNRTKLAERLRKAWNSGKKFKLPGTEDLASKLVATSVAVAFARHLLELKFIYRGGITTPTGPTPMIGYIPFIF